MLQPFNAAPRRGRAPLLGGPFSWVCPRLRPLHAPASFAARPALPRVPCAVCTRALHIAADPGSHTPNAGRRAASACPLCKQGRRCSCSCCTALHCRRTAQPLQQDCPFLPTPGAMPTRMRCIACGPAAGQPWSRSVAPNPSGSIDPGAAVAAGAALSRGGFYLCQRRLLLCQLAAGAQTSSVAMKNRQDAESFGTVCKNMDRRHLLG